MTETTEEGKKMNEVLIMLGVLALWFALQVWILPAMGIGT